MSTNIKVIYLFGFTYFGFHSEKENENSLKLG